MGRGACFGSGGPAANKKGRQFGKGEAEAPGLRVGKRKEPVHSVIRKGRVSVRWASAAKNVSLLHLQPVSVCVCVFALPEAVLFLAASHIFMGDEDRLE